MSRKTDQLSWWAVAPRARFADQCCARFEANFDNAPTFIVRSDTVAPRKTPRTTAPAAHLHRARRIANVKQVSSRMSARAMESSGPLVG